MKIDLYTKTVLTVIAACLVWICISGVTPVARAQAQPDQAAQGPAVPPTRVMLVDEENRPIHVQGLRVHSGGVPLPVDVGASPLPVAVRSIQRGGAWDSFDVRVLREAPTARPIP